MVALLVVALGIEGALILIGVEILAHLKRQQAERQEQSDMTQELLAADGVHEARLDEQAVEIKRLKVMVNHLLESRGEERIA